MPLPDHSHIVREVFNLGNWDFVSHSGLQVFSEAVIRALNAVDANWGHLKKYGGATQTPNSHAIDAALYRIPQDGPFLQSIDFLIDAERPYAKPGWSPDTPRYAITDWLDPSSLGVPCRLGCSLFWAPVGYRSKRQLLTDNLGWVRDELGADYIRIIAKMGNPADPDDPWTEMGGKAQWLTAPLIAEITDFVASFGLKTEWTLLGDLFEVESDDARARFTDRFIHALAPRMNEVEHLEVMNEYVVNGGSTHILRAVARQLRDGLPGALISLSSPTSTHNGGNIPEEVYRMYGGDSGGNMITPHWDRETNLPPELGPHAPVLRSSNEPRGPFASVAQTTDPSTLVGDYRRAAEAGYKWYVYHSDPGVWSDGLAPWWRQPHRGIYRNLWDIPNADAISSALRAYRRSGAVVTLPPPPPPPPGENDMTPNPYPSEQPGQFWEAFEADVHRLLRLAYHAGTRPTLYMTLADHRVFARMGHSSAHEYPLDAARRKHLNEMADWLSIPHQF